MDGLSHVSLVNWPIRGRNSEGEGEGGVLLQPSRARSAANLPAGVAGGLDDPDGLDWIGWIGWIGWADGLGWAWMEDGWMGGWVDGIGLWIVSLHSWESQPQEGHWHSLNPGTALDGERPQRVQHPPPVSFFCRRTGLAMDALHLESSLAESDQTDTELRLRRAGRERANGHGWMRCIGTIASTALHCTAHANANADASRPGHGGGGVEDT